MPWFKSFLEERTKNVKIGDDCSHLSELLYSVAQGSVLGPIVFMIYIRSFYKHVADTKFNVKVYFQPSIQGGKDNMIMAPPSVQLQSFILERLHLFR